MIKTPQQLKALVRNLSKGDSTRAQIILRKFFNNIFRVLFQLIAQKNEFPLLFSRRNSTRMAQTKPCTIYLGEFREAI